MRKFTSRFVSVSSIWCCTAILYTLFLIGTHGQKSGAYMDFYPWLGFALLFYIINALLLRRGLPENTYVGLNVAFIAFLVVFGNAFFIHGAEFIGRVAGSVFLLVPGIMAFVVARKPLSANTVLNFLEGAIVLFIFYIFMEEGDTGSGNFFNIPMVAALVLSFVSIILMRTVSGNRSRVQGSRLAGGFMMAAIFAVIILIAVGGLLVFAGGIRTGLSGLLSALTSLGEAFAAALRKLMEFLAQFASEEEVEPAAPEGTMGSPGSEMEAFSQMDWGYTPIIVIGAIVAAAVIGILIWMRKNRGSRLPAQAVVKGAPEKRAFIQNRLWERLAQWLEKIKQRLIFAWQKIVYRNTIPGMLLCAESWGNRRKIRREKGESGSHYIQRLALAMDEKSMEKEDYELLENFGRMVDLYFYSKDGCVLEENSRKRLKKIFR